MRYYLLTFLALYNLTSLAIAPPQPKLPVKAFVLIDANSNRVLAAKNPDTPFDPASLTKLMSLYVISNSLEHQQIKLEDQVLISPHAWRQEGSRMFIKPNTRVPLEQLIHGVIVASGNDAVMALAEHTAGSEAGFVDLMNNFASQLKLSNTHFTNPTGMPDNAHKASARDLATIARRTILDYPAHYQWYKQKWFTYNKIRQPNRNRLLWSDSSTDGLKTGHTNAAGYCLVASAKRNNMRLIAVVMGAKSDQARTNAARQLLEFGFRFYETKALFNANQPVTNLQTWAGKHNSTPIGTIEPLIITVAKGHEQDISTKINLPKSLSAPINYHTSVGNIIIKSNNQEIANYPLYTLTNNPQGSTIKRSIDAIKAWIHG